MSAISPGKGISHAPPSHMEQSKVSSYTQHHPSNVQALQVFKSILSSCYGPYGHLKMIQNKCGGHVTVTSSSKRLLASLSLSKPILKLIAAAVEGHLRVYSDGGLYTGLLACSLIQGCWETGLHPALCIAVNEILAEMCLSAMSSSCRVPVNVASVKSLLCLVKSIVRSKPAVGMTEQEICIVTSLVVESFISAVPSSAQAGQLTIPQVQIIGVQSQAVSESHIIQGILVETPDIAAFFTKDLSPLRDQHSSEQRTVRVAVFNISLAGDSEEYEEGRYELAPGVEVGDATLVGLRGLVGRLEQLRVGLVACQKVIHPSIKRRLRQQGILTLDRVSLMHIGSVQQIAGAALLSSLDPSFPESSLGHLTDIRHHVMFGKSYLMLSSRASSVCSLVLCHPTETGLQELKHICEVSHHALGLTLRDPVAVPGAGCLEFVLAHHIRQQAKDVTQRTLQEIGCTSTQLLQMTEKFAASLEAVAMATDHEGGHHITDSTSCHRWSLPRGAMTDTDWLNGLGRCGCGMRSASELRDSAWTVAGSLRCGSYRLERPPAVPPSAASHDQPRDERGDTGDQVSASDGTPARHDGSPGRRKSGSILPWEDDKQEIVLDLFSVKYSAFRVAVEIANMVLRIGHTVENVN